MTGRNRVERLSGAGYREARFRLPYRLSFQRLLAVENHGDDILVTHCGVDHHVIKTACGPVSAEVVFYKFDTIAVHGVDQFFGLLLTVSEQAQAAQLLRPRSVEKHMERVGLGAQEIRRSSSHDTQFPAEAARVMTS